MKVISVFSKTLDSGIKPYVDDVGTLIEVETDVILTGNAILEMRMVKPDGTTVAWTATIKGTDSSVAQYTVKVNDFDTVGIWHGQIYVSWDVNNIWSGAPFSFELFALGA